MDNQLINLYLTKITITTEFENNGHSSMGLDSITT